MRRDRQAGIYIHSKHHLAGRLRAGGRHRASREICSQAISAPRTGCCHSTSVVSLSLRSLPVYYLWRQRSRPPSYSSAAQERCRRDVCIGNGTVMGQEPDWTLIIEQAKGWQREFESSRSPERLPAFLRAIEIYEA